MDSKELVGQDSWRQRSELEALADLSPELEKELDRLDQEFWVSSEKLKIIVKRFIEELNEGLEAGGKNIPMNLTWVTSSPSGKEKGTYLTLDLGGTNLRVCLVTLLGEGKHELNQEQYKLPSDIKTSNANKLWSYVADSLKTFLDQNDLSKKYSKEDPLPLGFCFSYPATQHRIDHGILQTWTKGFDISGVEGQDTAAQLRSAMDDLQLPIELVALANDTVGAMIASAYTDPKTIIGAIFGTGCNAAYMEDCGSIPKLKDSKAGKDLKAHTPMAINCEYGAFDNAVRVLPRTKYDDRIDEESPRPGEQAFEKLSAGLYLGEIFRQVLTDLASRELVFKGKDIKKLQEPYSIDTGFLSQIEDDESSKFQETRDLFKSTLSIELSDQELELSRRLAELIAVRGARLCACGIAAICTKKSIKKGHVAADGSVANKHPKFKRRWAKALGEILGWEGGEEPITITSAEDGSGVGLAIIAAMILGGRGK